MEHERTTTHQHWLSLATVLVLIAGLGYFQHAVRIEHGFDITRPYTGPALLSLAALLIPFFVAMWFTRRRGVTWSHYGLNGKMPLWQISLFAVLVLAAVRLSVPYTIAPLAQQFTAAPIDVSHLDSLTGNLAGLLLALVLVWITAAFLEELLFRGFLLNEIADGLGGGGTAFIGAAILQGAIFGLVHSYQGPQGIVLTGGVGILMGLLYLVAKRNLWPLIIAHGLVDTYSLWLIYLSG